MVFASEPGIVKSCVDRDMSGVVLVLVLFSHLTIRGRHEVYDDLDRVLPLCWSIQHKYQIKLEIQDIKILDIESFSHPLLDLL